MGQKMRLFPILLHTGILSLTPPVKAVTPQEFSPDSFLQRVYGNNLDIKSIQAEVQAEKDTISVKKSLSNPKIGIMQETNMTPDQQQMGPMKTWQISQEIKFPTKYFTQGEAQELQYKMKKAIYLDKKLELRQKSLSLYYNYYASEKILSLLRAQKETLREISRIVENRRAIGSAHQQDEMKAHLEQTKIENEILIQSQKVLDNQYALNAIINENLDTPIHLPKKDLDAPLLKEKRDTIINQSMESSQQILAQISSLKKSESELELKKLSYLPDFMISYKKPFGSSNQANAYAIGFEMSIPLWFWSNQRKEVSAASARKRSAQNTLEQTKLNILAQVKSLNSKAETYSKLLKIYQTALIPQSTSSLNSSRSAYSAGKVGFQSLLDSERSLFAVRIDYYKTLTQFVETLAQLERVLGASLSDLPFDIGDNQDV